MKLSVFEVYLLRVCVCLCVCALDALLRQAERCPPPAPIGEGLATLLEGVLSRNISMFSAIAGPASAPVKVKVTQSCLTLCNPMDCTVHGIFQVRILEWVAFPFSRGSCQPRDRTQVFHIAGGFFTS